MANEKDKELYQEVERAFDRAAMALNDLAKEHLQARDKFGSSSRITQKKADQLSALSNLYDKALAYINHLRALNASMQEDFITREMARFKIETGLTYEKIARLAGWKDPERWIVIDKAEAVIEKVTPGAVERELSFEVFLSGLKRWTHEKPGKS